MNFIFTEIKLSLSAHGPGFSISPQFAAVDVDPVQLSQAEQLRQQSRSGRSSSHFSLLGSDITQFWPSFNWTGAATSGFNFKLHVSPRDLEMFSGQI